MVLSGLLAVLLALPVNGPALQRAMSFVGSPYRFGGTTERGFDCAGMVRSAYAASGIELPRTAAAQFAKGEPVNRDALRPGDLVFFRNTYRRGISHVGIYVGAGRFIHAASSRGVTTDELDDAYYRRRFAGGRRIGHL